MPKGNNLKEEIYKLVEVFYQHEFKIFHVNSIDEEKFIKPVGVFVSLGLTTSIATLNNIKNILEENGYVARLAEISSKKLGGQYLNTLTKRTPEQYKIDTTDSSTTLNEEQAKSELQRLEQSLSVDQDLEVLTKTASKIASLKALIEKLSLTNGWDNHIIQVTDDNEYNIFHKNVNYMKSGDAEYRIGIYVVNKD